MKKLMLAVVVMMSGCAVTSHQAQPSKLGTAKSTADLLASLPEPGVVDLETVASADWAVDRSGLINLGNPIAKDAGLVDGDEKIQVFFHVIRHPTRGTFIVDTGVETALRDAPEKSAMSGIVRSAMHLEKLEVHQPLGEWLAKEGKLDGVFLTHLHLDHVTGMADVPKGTPVFTGPGESKDSQFMYLFVQGSADRALEGKPALSEWQFAADPTGTFDGVLDIFGDGSVWALWVPGHTPGSTAYLVRTKTGPVLLTGDASHTRWGWEHHVEPGTFTGNAPRGLASFQKLQAFVSAHPDVVVRFGHQH
jgi:glyoxylase-like metal-dependent hydrolase (beta-lactamase superfamily II)